MVLASLLDTGAWLSYVSSSLACRIEKELKGVRGTGRYKVIDAFQKAHYFLNDISFRVSLRTGDRDTDVKSWIVKAVVVNIDFATELLLGLKDIKRMKLFRHIPELVEDVD